MQIREPNEKPRKQFAYKWDHLYPMNPKERRYAKKVIHKMIRLRVREAIRRSVD